MNPWQTPFQVWQDIMEHREPGFNAAKGFKYEPFEGNASTRWGLAFEDSIIRIAEGIAGRSIVSREREFSHSEYPFITCHIDGGYQASQSLHEGKTSNAFGFRDKWGEPGTDLIPIEYQIQVQHQMLCTTADECIVSVLVFPKRPDEWEEEGWRVIPQNNGSYLLGRKIEEGSLKGCGHVNDPKQWAVILAQMGYFHQYPVKADKELQAKLVEKYVAWWEAHVIKQTPPKPIVYDDIRAMITAPSGTIIVDDDTMRWFKEYKNIGSEISQTGRLAKRRNQLKTLILDKARALEATLDDESTDKWIFRDSQGKKLGSYGREASGNMVFR